MHLRTFSRGLTELFPENVVVGRELFWLINDNDHTQLSHWPSPTFFSFKTQDRQPIRATGSSSAIPRSPDLASTTVKIHPCTLRSTSCRRSRIAFPSLLGVKRRQFR